MKKAFTLFDLLACIAVVGISAYFIQTLRKSIPMPTEGVCIGIVNDINSTGILEGAKAWNGSMTLAGSTDRRYFSLRDATVASQVEASIGKEIKFHYNYNGSTYLVTSVNNLPIKLEK